MQHQDLAAATDASEMDHMQVAAALPLTSERQARQWAVGGPIEVGMVGGCMTAWCKRCNANSLWLA